MGMIDYWKRCVFEKYADFGGRARRSEYWYFALGNFLIGIGLMIVMRVFAAINDTLAIIPMLAYAVFALGTIIPGIAVAVRRMHDTGKSGWMLLLGLIPLVGGIIVLVFMVQDSQYQANQWGPNPKSDAPGGYGGGGDTNLGRHLVD